MQISDDVDHAKVYALRNEISVVIQRVTDADPDLGHPELLVCLLDLMANAIAFIKCPGCREMAVHNVKGLLPELAKEALEEGRRRWGEQPGSGHIH